MIPKIQPQVFSLPSFFDEINQWFQHDKHNLFNNVRILLNKLSRKSLKSIASEILHPDQYAIDLEKEQLYLYILDIIDTKFLQRISKSNDNKKRLKPKNVCVVHFVNKGIDHLHLPTIFKNPNIVALLPEVLKEEENLPTVTTSLDSPIRNKILNYKKTVTDLNIIQENGTHVVQDLPECECTESQFCDQYHQHIVTGDLRMIDNKKLRGLIFKGPNLENHDF